jgi:AbrB family looped-hinge helix DNA binding protein
MALAQSKVTAQGQISVPADVRKKLGIGPGSILEWYEEGDKIVVRRAGLYSSEAFASSGVPKGTPEERRWRN